MHQHQNHLHNLENPDQAIASDLDEYTNTNPDGSYKPMTQEAALTIA